jgi:hypothetical protein
MSENKYGTYILDNQLIDLIFGNFQIKKTYFLCCSKMVSVSMIADKEFLKLYSDDDNEKEYFKIKISDIVTVNKRQITVKDVNMISIFYIKDREPLSKLKNTGNKKIHPFQKKLIELKLKCNTRKDVVDIINKFRERKITNFAFNNDLKEEETSLDTMMNSLNSVRKSPLDTYIKLSNIEYLMKRNVKDYVLENLKTRLIYQEKKEKYLINDTPEYSSILSSNKKSKVDCDVVIRLVSDESQTPERNLPLEEKNLDLSIKLNTQEEVPEKIKAEEIDETSSIITFGSKSFHFSKYLDYFDETDTKTSLNKPTEINNQMGKLSSSERNEV